LASPLHFWDDQRKKERKIEKEKEREREKKKKREREKKKKKKREREKKNLWLLSMWTRANVVAPNVFLF
jgi:hypothetical protein